MDSFLSWEYVASFMGIVLCNSMVVEYTKELPFIKKIPTKYYAGIVAFTLILITSITLGTFRVNDVPLMMLNAILIVFTTTGQYNFHYSKVKLTEVKDEKEEKIGL